MPEVIFEESESTLESLDESLFYNDNPTRYSTDLTRTGLPRYEEVQVRFNNILQKRDQLEENLTGSQITHLLDYYVERSFDLLEWVKHPQFYEEAQKEYIRIVRGLLKNKRKLFSIRFANEEIYDTLVELFFEQDIKVFKNRFLSIKLNREMYLDFLDSLFKKEMFKDESCIPYFRFYRRQYTEVKNLLLGNYIRYSFVETNKFFSYYKDSMPLEAKEDYFSGLMLVILRVIDKYDSFKGTLTSFIENWFKDYRTTFRARQVLTDNMINIEDENYSNDHSLETESIETTLSERDDLRRKFLEEVLVSTGENLVSLRTFLKKHEDLFPTLKRIVL